MKLNRLIQMAAFLVVVLAFTACDEDYTEIGGEIINNPTNVELREVEVNAYSQKINSVQTNNLNNFFLGVNNNPVYGESTAGIVTQINLSNPNPSFGTNPELDSVVMTLPYFSSQTENSTSENLEYQLDSVYGNGTFKLSVFETSYFLNDLDPDADFEQNQKYYSDQQAIVEQNIIGDPLYQNESFEPSAAGYVSYEVNSAGENDTITKTPAFRVKLPVEYFQQKILDKEGSDELLSNSNFKNYFRSLFFKAEANGSEGRQILFNLASTDSKITLYYTSENAEDSEVRDRGSYALQIGGNKFNTFAGEFPEEINQKIASQDSITGAENLYLKGQEGSMAIIKIIPDSLELAELRGKNWLINEANLIFYVNQDVLGNAVEPERILLYDIDNNRALLDYTNDPLVSEGNPLNSRLTFSSRLERDEDENGVFYRIRITQHLTNILNGADNAHLGLVITGDINSSVLSAVKGVEGVERVPASTLLNPYGTVLYGNESSDDEKRLKLRIYYTDYN